MAAADAARLQHAALGAGIDDVAIGTVWLKPEMVAQRQRGDLLVITNIRRMRGRPEEMRNLVKNVADADGGEAKVLLPQDLVQAAVNQAPKAH